MTSQSSLRAWLTNTCTYSVHVPYSYLLYMMHKFLALTNWPVSAAWWEFPSLPAQQPRVFLKPWWSDCGPSPDSSQCHTPCAQWCHEQSQIGGSHCQMKVRQIENVVPLQGHGRPTCVCECVQLTHSIEGIQSLHYLYPSSCRAQIFVSQ